MPKKVLIVDRFEGGLNSFSDDKDIKDNQFSKFENASPFEYGIIKPCTRFENVVYENGSITPDNTHGRGLFVFNSDYSDYADEGLGVSLVTNTTYAIINNGVCFSILSGSDLDTLSSWDLGEETGLTWEDGQTNDPIAYFVKNGLRVYNTAYTSTYYTPPLWRGYVKGEKYGFDDSSSTSYNGYGWAINVGTTIATANTLSNQVFEKAAQIKGCFLEEECILPAGTVDDGLQNTIVGVNLIMYNHLGHENKWGEHANQNGAADGEAHGAGFANETVDTGDGPNDQTVSTSGMYWGLANQFAEGANGSGTWQPSDDVMYQFYATTVYDGKQESNPQLFTMYSTQELKSDVSTRDDGNYVGTVPSLQLKFSNGYDVAGHGGSDTSSHVPEDIGSMVSLSLSPVVKLNGAEHTDNATVPGGNSGAYNFGATDSNGNPDIDSRENGNPRITGVKCYWASNEDGYNEKWLLYEWDFRKGIKPIGAGSRQTDGEGWVQPDSTRQDKPTNPASYWYQHVHGDGVDGVGFMWKNPPKVYSYTTLNLHPPDDHITVESFKSSCVANGRTWIANYTKIEDGIYQQYQDSMIKSPVGCYDKFPKSNEITVIRNDGEAIVEIIEYADRILQFKEKKLFIINVSGESEFIEAEFEYKGVPSSGMVYKTDFGILWGNEHGAYLYDGSRIRDLFLGKDGLSRIRDSEWFYSGSSHYPFVVGYDPVDKIGYFIASASNKDRAFKYSFLMDAWIENGSSDKFIDHSDGHLSNAVLINGSLAFWNKNDNTYGTGTGTTKARLTALTPVDDLSASTFTIDIYTKNFDFGNLNRRKKIYNIVANYKNGSANLKLKWKANGTGSWTEAGALDDTSGAWYREKFNVGDQADLKNCYTVQLQITGGIDKDFALNDISIVYRDKTLK